MNDFRNFEVGGIKLYRSEFDKDWLSYLDDPKIVLEFGSYDGGDGAFYKKTFPGSRVISIEASPARYRIINSYSDNLGIEPYNYAISDKTGQTDFYEVFDPNVVDCQDKTGSSGSMNRRTDLYGSLFGHLKEKPPVTVESIRLDDFCGRLGISQIDFMHVDVEGAEHKALIGLGDLRPKIMWLERYLGKEYYGESAYNVGDIEKICESMGYRIIESTSADILVQLV